MGSPFKSRISHLGSFAAIGCGIHCMLMPLLVSILPLIGMTWMQSKGFEIGMMLIAVIFSTAGMCWGFKTHKRFMPACILTAGSLVMLANFQHNHDHGHSHGLFSPILSGVCFLVANLLNHRFCKHCKKCCHE